MAEEMEGRRRAKSHSRNGGETERAAHYRWERPLQAALSGTPSQVVEQEFALDETVFLIRPLQREVRASRLK